jgi:hypothetical protein
MNGTSAINPNQLNNLSSRYADTSLSTTADPGAIATQILGSCLTVPWITKAQTENIKDESEHFTTEVILTEKSFEVFMDTINTPPKPNEKLYRLMQHKF